MPSLRAYTQRGAAVPLADTHSRTLIFGARLRLSFAARSNLTEMRGHRRGQRSLETHQLYQPYRAQAPTAMAT